MGETKLTFKRYEKKYLLSAEEYRDLLARMAPYIEPEYYHRGTVCSIYYDGDDFHLIRHSIDAPIYKEKLRVRCYQPGSDDSEVFVELKKKYKGIVYDSSGSVCIIPHSRPVVQQPFRNEPRL